MKTLKRIEIKPVFVDEIPKELNENTFYVCTQYKVIVHLCLCGCKNKSVTPINEKFGWNLFNIKNNIISLTPSILNTNCPNSYHYILTNNIANVC